MRCRRFTSLFSCWGVALLPTISVAANEEQERPAPRTGSPDHYLLVKLSVELDDDGMAPLTGATGLEALDALNQAEGAVWVRKLFRDPPRGHRSPTAWNRIGLGRWLHIELGPRDDLDAVVGRYRALSCVEIAERDRYVQPTVIPNDTDYASRQWDLHPNRCDAEGAWNTITDSSDVLLFVIDTGVERTHSDFANNVWTNPGEVPGNGLDDDGNGFVDDVYGWDFVNDDATVEDDWPHGMHVSGILGAEGNNAHMVAGINWSCTVGHAKMFASTHGTDEFGAQATIYAADQGAQVTNNSWGDSFPTGPIQDAVEYADSLDVLQVAAAGNKGDDNPHYPAVFPEMLAVSSTDSSDNRSSWSSHGSWIDMSAPGEGIYSLMIGDGTATLSGTSMASPHVAGAGALVRSVNPQLTNLEARWVLRHASDDLGPLGFDDDYGWGRLDIAQAVKTAGSLSLSDTEVAAGDSVTLSLSQPDEAGMLYFALAGTSGSVPGLSLSGYDPSDARVFPLNLDFWVSWQLAVQPHPLAQDFLGTLDAQGEATATFATLNHPAMVDETFSVAYVTMDPNDLSHVRFISCPLSFTVLP